MTAMDELRALVKRFDSVHEGFNDRFTVDQILQLNRMWKLCGWDFYPDQWSDRQVQEALQGTVPQWDHRYRPKYSEEP